MTPFRDQLWDQLYSIQLWRRLSGQLRSLRWDQLRGQLGSQLYSDQLSGQLWGQLREDREAA